MGKIIILTFIAVLAASDLGYAQWGPWKKSKPAAAAQAQPVSAAPKAMAPPAPEVLDKKKTGLNNTEWPIEVKPMGGKGKTQKDTLTFIDGKVVSKNMEGKGKNAPNFSVRLQDDGTLTWETMETSDKGTTFWRGDIGPDGIMRGVISKRDKKGTGVDFSFVSESSQKVTVAAAKPDSAMTEAVPENAAPADDKK
jgi:hypothetical protein